MTTIEIFGLIGLVMSLIKLVILSIKFGLEISQLIEKKDLLAKVSNEKNSKKQMILCLNKLYHLKK